MISIGEITMNDLLNIANITEEDRDKYARMTEDLNKKISQALNDFVFEWMDVSMPIKLSIARLVHMAYLSASETELKKILIEKLTTESKGQFIENEAGVMQ